MIRSSRDNYYKSPWNKDVEALEWRRLLSELPVLPASFQGSSSTLSPDNAGAGTGSEALSYGQAVPSSSEILAQPADGSQLTAPPLQIAVDFNRPIDSFDLGFADIRLDRINDNGSVTSMFDPFNWPQQVANNNDGFDQTFTRITISLDAPLEPGNYRIVLVGGSLISLNLAEGAWDPFEDYVLSSFSITDDTSGSGNRPDPTLDPIVASYQNLAPHSRIEGSIELGTLASEQTLRTDPLYGTASTPTANVVLYRFTIEEGHRWLVSLTATTQASIGNSTTSVQLFRIEEGGTLVPVSLTSLIHDYSSNKDRLTGHVGLDTGNYCLAVSGSFSAWATSSLSGSIQLEIGAKAADQATQVASFQLHDAGPSTTSPAGFTIGFSGPIVLTGFGQANESTLPLEVVDSSGEVWGTLPWGYLAEGNRLTMVFGEPLPAGEYRLRVASVNGLTDLAGWTPVNPDLPEGVLATWSVAPSTTSTQTAELGVVWPGGASPISRSTELAANETATYRFTLITPGFYKVQAMMATKSVYVTIFSGGRTVYLKTNTGQGVFSTNLFLPAGTYTIQWVSRSRGSVGFDWTLRTSQIDWESLIGNGVGQWSSLNIGFGGAVLGPSWSGPSPESPLVGPPSSLAPSEKAIPNAPGTPAPVTSANSLAIARSLLLTPSTGNPIGMPSVWTQQVASVGPSVISGSTAVADNAPSILDGISYGRSRAAFDSMTASIEFEAGSDSNAPVEAPTEQMPPVDPASTTEPNVPTVREAVETDRRVLASIDWILELGDRVQRWFEPGVQPNLSPLDDRTEDSLLLPSLADRQVEGASRGADDIRAGQTYAGLPLGVMITTALIYRAHQPIRRWWRKGSHGWMRSKPFGWMRSKLTDRSSSERGRVDEQARRHILNKPHFAMRRSSIRRHSHATSTQLTNASIKR